MGLELVASVPADLLEALHVVQHPEPVFRTSLHRAGTRAVEISRSDYLSGPRPARLDRRSGRLAASVTLDEGALPFEVAVGTNSPSGPANEFGAVVTARQGRWLHFQGGSGGRGGWVRVKSVRIPARPFIAPAVQDAAREFPSILQEEFERVTASGPGVDFS